MLTQTARAGLRRAYMQSLATEAERREAAPATAAANHLIDALNAMAARFQGLAYPGDVQVATELRRLARAKDFAGLEGKRVAADLSPAEVVALIISVGDRVAAERVLTRYARGG